MYKSSSVVTRVAEEVLRLPIYPDLKMRHVKNVVEIDYCNNSIVFT
jgi:hypothetical protein